MRGWVCQCIVGPVVSAVAPRCEHVGVGSRLGLCSSPFLYFSYTESAAVLLPVPPPSLPLSPIFSPSSHPLICPPFLPSLSHTFSIFTSTVLTSALIWTVPALLSGGQKCSVVRVCACVLGVCLKRISQIACHFNFSFLHLSANLSFSLQLQSKIVLSSKCCNFTVPEHNSPSRAE